MRADARAFLDQHRATRVPDLTTRLVDVIISGNPAYAGDATVPRDDLALSCHHNIAAVLELLGWALRGELPGTGTALFDPARTTGRRRAEQGMPLHDVLRSYRLGGRLIWDDLVDQAEELLDAEALREVGTRLWEVVDETSSEVALAYHETERGLVLADEQRKSALWEGLLGGRGKDPSFAGEATRILDLPEDGPYVVVASGDHETARHARSLAGSRLPSQWVRRAVGAAAIVAGHVASRDLSGEVAVALEGSAGTSVLGVSVPVAGAAELDLAFRQATLAVQTRAGAPGVSRFDSALPEALLITSAEVAGRLVEVRLGPVLALPPAEAQPLLETLRAWVDSGGSAVQAAEDAHCHRNTVLNRLHRVAELTGHDDVAASPPPLELALALRALRVVPSP